MAAIVSIPFALTPAALSQSNPDLVDQIPPLKPPRGEIPPGFWEKNGVWLVIAAIVALYLAFVAIWLLRRKAQAQSLPPEVEAREALKPFIGKSEDGNSMSQISRIVRRYFTEAFDLPRHELTTSEFSAASLASQPLGPDLAQRVAKFLMDCDQRKFAASTNPAPPWATPEAGALIELGEQRRQYLRQQEQAQPSMKDARQS